MERCFGGGSTISTSLIAVVPEAGYEINKIYPPGVALTVKRSPPPLLPACPSSQIARERSRRSENGSGCSCAPRDPAVSSAAGAAPDNPARRPRRGSPRRWAPRSCLARCGRCQRGSPHRSDRQRCRSTPSRRRSPDRSPGIARESAKPAVPPSMIPVNGSSFGRAGGRLRRDPGGTENASILATVRGSIPNCRAASRRLRPSICSA
jgi:hypothetical protein